MFTLRESCMMTLLEESPNRLDTVNTETGIDIIPDEELQKMKANCFASAIGKPHLFGNINWGTVLSNHAEQVIMGRERHLYDPTHSFQPWGVLTLQFTKGKNCFRSLRGDPFDFTNPQQKKTFEFYGYPLDSDHCFSHYCVRIYTESKRTFYDNV